MFYTINSYLLLVTMYVFMLTIILSNYQLCPVPLTRIVVTEIQLSLLWNVKKVLCVVQMMGALKGASMLSLHVEKTMYIERRGNTDY